MVDRLRAYRRWRSRRLGLLLPVFLGALVTQLWLAAGSSAPAWLRVVSLGTSGLILALIGYFLAQTLLCSRLHARGNRAGARVLREQLAPSGRAALAAAALLAILNTVPYLIPSPAAKPTPALSARRHHFPKAADPPMTVLPIESDIIAPPTIPEAPSGALPGPDVRPVLEGLPVRLAIEDSEASSELLTALALLGRPPRESNVTAREDERDGFPRYRPDVEDGFLLSVEGTADLSFNRLGVPAEGNPEEWLPPELRLEVSLLNGRDHGAEFSLQLDIPIGRDESIRMAIALGSLAGNEYMEESASESWERVTIAYSYRVAGYTRQAPFDLSLSVGISADRYRMDGADGLIDRGTRLSPYFAVDAALWQTGTAGLILHAGYSVPVNVTGGSSGVLDLSATVRIDLTENISIHAGYRYVILRLRDYDNALIGSRSNASLSEDFTGPILGIDVRF